MPVPPDTQWGGRWGTRRAALRKVHDGEILIGLTEIMADYIDICSECIKDSDYFTKTPRLSATI